jgi:hypothetical protein
MAHRIKCDGEVFSVPSGIVNDVLRNLHKYKKDGKIDYRALFLDLGSEQIMLDHTSPLFKEQVQTDFNTYRTNRHCEGEQMGYIDFDRMKQNGGKPVVVGMYYKLLGEELLPLVEIDKKTKRPKKDHFTDFTITRV